LRLPRHAGAVEVHTAALAFSAWHALATEEIFDRAELRGFAGVKLKVLPKEWHLLHNLLHHQLADRGHARRLLAIKGLWEFSRLGGELTQARWVAIIEHAEQRGFIDLLSSWAIQANRLFGLNAPDELMVVEAGRKHAEATFRQARRPYVLRRAAFVADRLRFGFAPKTLASRYAGAENTGQAALRHVNFLVRRQLRRTARSISFQDAHEVVRLTWMGMFAWIMPQFFWWPISRLLGRINVMMHHARTRSETAQIEQFTSVAARGNVHHIAAANWANRYEERFQYLRAWRPGGWTPRIDISGAAHVHDALARGRGVVFWGGNFSFSSLLTMMAIDRLGLAVARFSVPQHGFSNTRFGIRYLNRVCTGIENRYLDERVVAEPHEISAALQHLRARLTSNGAVYFAVGARGRRTVKVQFLGGCIRIATGPLAIARETGAALVPVFTLRIASGRFEVSFGTPISFPSSSLSDVDYTDAVQAYADALTPVVLRDPGQWCGWHLIKSWPAW
jgi:lauroyl/myristoyl acyltransferase